MYVHMYLLFKWIISLMKLKYVERGRDMISHWTLFFRIPMRMWFQFTDLHINKKILCAFLYYSNELYDWKFLYFWKCFRTRVILAARELPTLYFQCQMKTQITSQMNQGGATFICIQDWPKNLKSSLKDKNGGPLFKHDSETWTGNSSALNWA